MSLFERAKKARENKKGFTLVELIVVLVILAILAAIMVPQLVGYIDKAKEKQYKLDARNILIAAQTVLDEQYAHVAKGKTYTFTDGSQDEKDIIALSEVAGANITALTTATGSYKIDTMKITFADGEKASLASGTWTIGS